MPFVTSAARSEDERSLCELVKAWRITSRERQALTQAGTRSEASLGEIDLVNSMNAAMEAIALAPARSLAELALKAEVAAYWLDLNGGLDAVEAAVAEEWDGERYALQRIALSILRDLLRLAPPQEALRIDHSRQVRPNSHS